MENSLGIRGIEGDFIDSQGNFLGKHKGIIHYTIGQRKGLGKTFGKPMYVIEIDSEKNQVTLGPHDELFKDVLIAGDVNLISVESLEEPMEVTVKTRYKAPFVPATIYPYKDKMIMVKFKEKQRAITPGQAVVMYQGDIVVGGGKIMKDKVGL